MLFPLFFGLVCWSAGMLPIPALDDALLARVASDDADAFEQLYQLTNKRVYAYALSLLKNPQDAEDVLQDTFLKLRAAAHLYKPQGKPLAWILTIARNLSLMKLRVKSRFADPESVGMEDSLSFSYVTDRDDRIVLESALRVLDDTERQIILFHAVSGLRHHEIAQSLGMPLSTVLSKYHRGLKKLKKHLAEKEGL